MIFNRLLLLAVLPPLVVLSGTLGYMSLEGWGWQEALYMTTITISSVGYGEVLPLSPNGRLFTIGLIAVSFGTVAYALASLFTFVVEGGVVKLLKKMKKERLMKQLENHYIVCGMGRKGRAVCRQLLSHQIDFIAIERESEHMEEWEELGILVLQGDATDDHLLDQAGIQRAKGLIAILGDDADNVFLVLSARQLNPKLQIVAWASDPIMEKKLSRAGADRVLSPFELGGFQVVQTLLRPDVMDFLGFALDIENQDWALEQICLPEDSGMVGKNLQELQLSNYLKVLALIRNGERHFEITGETRLEAQDMLIVLGKRKELHRLHVRYLPGESGRAS
jgi:voltage-gated potassium channel